QDVVAVSGVEVLDRLISCDRRRLVHPVRERRRNGATEQVRRRWIEDSDAVIGRGRDIRVEVIADVTEFGLTQTVDVGGRSQQAELLTAKPDEAQLVQRIDVLPLLGALANSHRISS